MWILSERDILRAVASDFDGLRKRKVSDLMTTRVIVGLVEDSLDTVMSIMTEKRIRHLPIVDDGKLAGILSIGDMVKARAHHAEVAVRYLSVGLYPRDLPEPPEPPSPKTFLPAGLHMLGCSLRWLAQHSPSRQRLCCRLP